LLKAYNIPPKPMMITETGLLCDPACPLPEAYAVARFYTSALSYNLIGSLWYIYDGDGFHHTALVEPTNVSQLRPAYLAYQHAAAMLKGASYIGPLEGQPSGVEGYRFSLSYGMLIILWSTTNAQPVSLPVAPNANVTCTAWDGTPLSCSNSTGVVTLTADLGATYVITR
jgi:hypothetical protein